MVKPKWGYNYEKNKDTLIFPKGWNEGEKKEAIMTRRVFFEIKLHDWVVSHDIHGDGLLIKTVHQRGSGLDRVSLHDQIKIDLKIYQRDTIFREEKDLVTLVRDQKNIPKTIKVLLESMKRGEVISCLVQPAFFIHFDKDLRGKNPEDGGFPSISEDMIL